MDRTSTLKGVVRGLRAVNVQGSLFGQTVAIRLGLSETDIEALEMLVDVGSATAGKLAETMNLTTGAVTRMIDRLEQAGYVRRVPDPVDRRRVVVEPVTAKIAALAPVLESIPDAVAQEVSRYSDEQLSLIRDFLDRMIAATAAETAKLRQDPTGGAGAGVGVGDAGSGPGGGATGGGEGGGFGSESAGFGAAASGSAAGAGTPAAQAGPDLDWAAIGGEHSVPIGGLKRARLVFASGAVEVTLAADPNLPDLYRAKFEGAVPRVRERDGTVNVSYRRTLLDWGKRKSHFTLAGSIPWVVEVKGGASKLDGNLERARLERLEIAGGASTVRLSVGAPTGTVSIRILGGMSGLRLRRPAGVPVEVRVMGGPAKVEIDGRTSNGTGGPIRAATPGYETATDRYAIEIMGGASKVTID